MCAWCSRRSEEGTRSPGSGAMDGCKPLCSHLELNPCSLREQPELLVIEPSLQALLSYLYVQDPWACLTESKSCICSLCSLWGPHRNIRMWLLHYTLIKYFQICLHTLLGEQKSPWEASQWYYFVGVCVCTRVFMFVCVGVCRPEVSLQCHFSGVTHLVCIDRVSHWPGTHWLD